MVLLIPAAPIAKNYLRFSNRAVLPAGAGRFNTLAKLADEINIRLVSASCNSHARPQRSA